jgi:hypothetical protein
MKETINPIKQKYKYAADYGFILGGYIAIFFIIDYLFSGNSMASILGMVGLLGTPVVCYYLTKSYRDKGLGGYIRFGQAWSFGVWLFLFASLIMSVLYYVRFQFIQPDYIANAFNQTLQIFQQMHYPQEQMDALIAFGVPSAIQVVMTYLWLYIVGGALLFLLISPMVTRSKPENPTGDNGNDNTYQPYQDKNEPQP